MKRILLLASLLGLLAGCASPASAVPTPYPPEYLPTVVAMTAEALARAASDSATATALASALNSVPTETPEPTLTFTPAPTYTPTSIPLHKPAAIEIQAPGPMSKVLSPISLRMNIQAGASRRVQIDLYGEDGRLLSRTLKRNVPTSGRGILQTAKIPFEIPAAAEVGRITVSTFDKEGRIQSLNSVRVLLLSSGVDEITPAGNPSEPVGVVEPGAGEAVSGGVLTVRGDVWPFNLQPVIFELVDAEGKSLGLRILYVTSIQPQLFETTIPYRVAETTPARLVIRQDDDRIPGLFYLYSQEVTLNP
ncbi:MAG: hypothetical protein ACOYYF_15425 [Chloroflexota bacterium]|nr:hypothetical protein [Chloroflexota bacterium]MBI5705245.1 hypothetical protein [Chloroflexota bacterium]